MIINIGFSPCPNDTFIFDALVNGKIDTQGLQFVPYIADVEELNRLAFANTLEVSKLSYHALGHLQNSYTPLQSGSALGTHCGPLLVSNKPLSPEQVSGLHVAIPGTYTTANFLFRWAFGEPRRVSEVLFSDIEDAVLTEKVNCGLLIHENRFTYAERGLHLIADLGDWWETRTGLPIPLGGIAASKRLPTKIAQQIDALIRQSVEYAFANPDDVMPFVRKHAQTMSDDIMRKHIDLYVNHYTRQLNEQGQKAVNYLFEIIKKSLP